jgi:3-oxoacyl-[acyl-carrier-protein] synthase II
MNDRRVVITGSGVVSPFGIGKKIYWDNLTNGNSASKLITAFDTSELPVKFFADLKMKDSELENYIADRKSTKTMSRSGKFGMIAADEAFLESGLDISMIDPNRFGTCLGAGGLGFWDIDYSDKFFELVKKSELNESRETGFPEIWNNLMQNLPPLTPLKALPNITTAHIAIKYNARGICQTISTACTSSSNAIGEAYKQIKHGYADIMITGGSDSMTNPNGLVAFSILGVVSRNNEEYQTASRPFDKRRDGFMIGEGAAIFILEDYEHCRKRGAEVYAEIVGYSGTNDAYRLTDEPPDAGGAVVAMKQAIMGAEISADRVDYINAHGTGTVMNDKTETLAIKKVFGEHAYSVPISSTKSMVGHLVASAGAIEFAACLLSLKNQIITPTINYKVTDEECDLDYVPNISRDAKLEIVQSNSFGFGGQNTCLIIKQI